MSDSELQIAFGADASAVTAAAGEARAAIGSMLSSVQGLTASLKALQNTGKTAFGAVKGGEAAQGLQKLTDQWVAWENTHNSTLRDMQADELQFWSTIVTAAQRAALSPQQSAELTRKVQSLQHAEAMKEIQEEIAAHQQAADQAIAAIQQELEAKKAAIDAQIAAVEEAARRGETSEASAHAQILTLIQQEQQASIAAATAIYQARVDADDWTKAHAEQTTQAYRAAQKAEVVAADQRNQSIEAANLETNKRIQAQNAEATQQFKQQWDSVINPLVSDMSRGLLQMAEGGKSFGKIMAEMGDQILQNMLGVIDKMVERWLWGEVAQTGATNAQSLIRKSIQSVESLFGIATAKTTGAVDISASAAQAFAAAWASTAAIPIIGPELAPASASAAYAGAMGAEGLMAAAGGFDVPSGVNPITQLHQQEMVLPARIANPMRRMINDYQAAGGGASGATAAASGDTHVHMHINGAMDGPAFRDFLRTNKDHLQTVMGEMVRAGKAPGMGLATA